MNQSTIDLFRYTDEALLFVLRVCINIESSPKTVEQWNLRKLHVLVLKYTSIAVILIYYSSLLLTFNRKPLMWMDLLDIHVHVQCSSRSQACQITLYLSIYNQRIRLNQGIIDLNLKIIEVIIIRTRVIRKPVSYQYQLAELIDYQNSKHFKKTKKKPRKINVHEIESIFFENWIYTKKVRW